MSRPLTPSDLREIRDLLKPERNTSVWVVSASWILPSALRVLRALKVKYVVLNHNFQMIGLTRERRQRMEDRARARWFNGSLIWRERYPHLGVGYIPDRPPKEVNRYDFQRVLSKKLKPILWEIKSLINVFYPELKEKSREFYELRRRLLEALQKGDRGEEKGILSRIWELTLTASTGPPRL
jgi:hypothetical protein